MQALGRYWGHHNSTGVCRETPSTDKKVETQNERLVQGYTDGNCELLDSQD